MTPHVQPEGIESFIAHTVRLSGESRVGSQDGPKMAGENKACRWLGGFMVAEGGAGVRTQVPEGRKQDREG